MTVEQSPPKGPVTGSNPVGITNQAIMNIKEISDISDNLNILDMAERGKNTRGVVAQIRRTMFLIRFSHYSCVAQ